jgi:drug/metabolite transporter (DMT)-like permease
VACATKRHCCAWNITLTDNNANATQAVAPAQTWLNKLSQRPWWADLLLLSAVWGSSFMFTKIAAQDIGAMPTAFGRVAVAALFLVPLLLWKRETASLAQHWKKAFLIGIFNSGIPFAAYAYALLTISTSTGAIVNASTALFGAVIAWLWLKDKPSLSRTIGLVLGFTGVCLLALQNARSAPTGDLTSQLVGMLVCLLAPLCYGLSASYTKLHFSGVPALVSATGSQLGAALFLAPFALWLWPDHAMQWGTIASLLVIGVVCTGMAYILFFRIIELAGASKALTVTYAVPVFAVFYGVTFLGETITMPMVLCAGVILVGISLSTGLLRLPGTKA